MPDMHRLGHVRPAKIDHGHMRVGRQLATRHGPVSQNVRRTGRQNGIGHADIDKARPRHLRRQDSRIGLQRRGNLAGNLARVPAGRLGRAHRAIALEIGEFRLVGTAHIAPPFLQPHGREGGASGGRQVSDQAGHGYCSALRRTTISKFEPAIDSSSRGISIRLNDSVLPASFRPLKSASTEKYSLARTLPLRRVTATKYG